MCLSIRRINGQCVHTVGPAAAGRAGQLYLFSLIVQFHETDGSAPVLVVIECLRDRRAQHSSPLTARRKEASVINFLLLMCGGRINQLFTPILDGAIWSQRSQLLYFARRPCTGAIGVLLGKAVYECMLAVLEYSMGRRALCLRQASRSRFNGKHIKFMMNWFLRPDHSSFFSHQTVWQYSDGDPVTEAQNARGYKKQRFSINISLYLGNNTRQSHSYGRRIQEVVANLSNDTISNDLE